MWRRQLLCVSSALLTAAIKPQHRCRGMAVSRPSPGSVRSGTVGNQSEGRQSRGPVKVQSRNDPRPAQDEHRTSPQGQSGTDLGPVQGTVKRLL